MVRRHLRRFSYAAQRMAPLLALAGFVAGTIGVPVPRIVYRGKDRLQPYPCMDHVCGCASADQCWQSCCCFTNRQKLAWAAEHGVTPPAYVFAAAERERPATSKTCCAAHQDCCEHEHAHDADCCEHEVAAAPTAAPGLTIEFVLAVKARQCRGQAELWLAMGAISLPPENFAVAQAAADCGATTCVLPRLCGIATSPEAPPPRV